MDNILDKSSAVTLIERHIEKALEYCGTDARALAVWFLAKTKPMAMYVGDKNDRAVLRGFRVVIDLVVEE